MLGKRSRYNWNFSPHLSDKHAYILERPALNVETRNFLMIIR